MNLRCWQKNIEDGRDVLSLNMAGSHDCVTQFVQLPYLARCQDTDIYNQLCMGIRGLDIRVQPKGSRLGMVHGFTKAFNTPNRLKKQMDMADVLGHCYRFLDENPTEAIVFQFKNDSGKHQEQCFDNLMNTYILPDKERWFLENRAPRMKEARGKIILLRRCRKRNSDEYNDSNSGIDFSSWIEQDKAVYKPLTLNTGGENPMEFVIQDRFKYKPEPRWHQCIKPFLDSMTELEGKYVINYLSTAGGLKGPLRNSRFINPMFLDYPLQKGVYYGMIYMDFPTKQLAEKIINTNFNV